MDFSKQNKIKDDTQIEHVDLDLRKDLVIFSSTNKYDFENNTKNIIDDYTKKFGYVNKKKSEIGPGFKSIYSINNLNIYMNNLISTEIYMRFLKSESKIIEIPLCFYLNDPWNYNFAHLIHQNLGHILTLSKIDNQIPILMHFEQNYKNNILDFFEIKNPIIQRYEHNVYKIKNAIMTNVGSECVSKNDILKIRSIIERKIDFKPNLQKNGLLLKRLVPQRQIHNFNEILENLKNDFPDVKWEIYDGTEEFSVYIKKFIEADIVIGMHGAGFGNIIFCKKDCIVIEIMLKEFLHPCFIQIQHHLQMDNYCVIYLSNEHDQTFSINLDYDILKNQLNQKLRHY